MTISVVMSVYNEDIKWVKKSIESILNQTISDFEFIIIIDNPQISEKIDKYLIDISNRDSRIKLLRNSRNLGLALSLNKGIEEAKGEYIARMDADDISELNRLELELEFIKITKADVVSTDRIIIDEDDNVLSYPDEIKGDPNILLPYASMIVHPSVLMKADAVKQLNGYRPFPRSQDYDLWLRMLSKKKRIAILNKRLLRYRVRTSSLTNNNRLEQFYIHHYQKKLFKERTKYGVDSFSIESFKKYLRAKHITDSKNRKCINVMGMMEYSQICINKGEKVKGILSIIRAFLIFPEVVFVIIINKFQRTRIEKLSKDL